MTQPARDDTVNKPFVTCKEKGRTNDAKRFVWEICMSEIGTAPTVA